MNEITIMIIFGLTSPVIQKSFQGECAIRIAARDFGPLKVALPWHIRYYCYYGFGGALQYETGAAIEVSSFQSNGFRMTLLLGPQLVCKRVLLQ